MKSKKGRPSERTTRRGPRFACRNPDVQTLKGHSPDGRIGTNLRPRSKRRAANLSAYQSPNTQTLVGRPPTRVEPNCDALDKLSGLQVRRGIIQAESRDELLPADALNCIVRLADWKQNVKKTPSLFHITWTAHHSGAHKNPRHARHLGFSNARNVDKRWGNLSTGHVTSCGGGAPCALSYCVYRPRCVTRSDSLTPKCSTKNSAACAQTSYVPRQASCS